MSWRCSICQKPYRFPPEETHPSCVVRVLVEGKKSLSPYNKPLLERRFLWHDDALPSTASDTGQTLQGMPLRGATIAKKGP